MKVLELFCGTKSISKEFEKLGYECFTVDFDRQFNPNLCADILTLNPEDFKEYDIIHASPPCQAFSVAQIGRNWYHDNTPKTESAKRGLAILNKTLDFIRVIKPKVWIIENPVGKMRKIIGLEGFRHSTVYCAYGFNRRKFTDFWTNLPTLSLAEPCKNGSPCHVAAPRGSTTGTQGMDSVSAGVIPELLCKEIALATNSYLRDRKVQYGW